MKIGVVDDGVDNTNPFLERRRLHAARRASRSATRGARTPKMIVARAFPGPGSGAAGQLPLDRNASFHGTHVAGIAAGDAGHLLARRAGPSRRPAASPASRRARGSATTASSTSRRRSATSPNRRRSPPRSSRGPRRHGRHQLLGRRPRVRAGERRHDPGDRTTSPPPASCPSSPPGTTATTSASAPSGSPGTAPDAITVAAVSNTHVFAPVADRVRRRRAGSCCAHPIADRAATDPGRVGDDRASSLVDVGSIIGRDGQPVDRHLCGAGRRPERERRPASGGLARRRDRARLPRLCTFVSKAERAQQAGAIGIILVDNRAGEANGIPVQLPVPAGMIADVDGAALRAAMGVDAAASTSASAAGIEDIETGRSGMVTSFSSAGPTAFGHLLKPDVAAPGGQILSSTLPRVHGGSPFAVFDGTSMAAPHVAGAAALLVQRHPTWTPQQVKSALMSTAGAAWGDTRARRRPR